MGAAFDITARRAAEARVALNEARLTEAQRTAHVGSFEWEIGSNLVTWTDELHRIYGLEPGQFEGTVEAFLARVYPEDLDLTLRVVGEACRRAGPFSYDHRIVRADGSVRSLHTRAQVFADAEGRPVRLAGSCWDVTELTEATKSRERLLSLIQATIEATTDGTLVVDSDRKVVLRNRRFLDLWRIPPELADCQDDMRLLGSVRSQLESPDEFIREVEEIYAHPESENTGQVRCSDGRIFERYSVPQRIGDAVVGRVWSFRDVSERERLLHSALFLSDATRLLASLEVEQALDGVARIAVPYMGEGCAIDVFGTTGPRRLVAISRDPKTPISPELHPSVLAGQSLIYQVGPISYLGVPLLMKGSLEGAITFCAAAHRRYQPSDVEVAEELARRAALALDNAWLYRRAQEALRARDEFLSVAAHELRGPVTAIHLAAQAIGKGKVRPEALSNMLAIIEREDRRLSQFVDELLDIGRIREGRLALRYEAVSLGEVVRNVARRLDLGAHSQPLVALRRRRGEHRRAVGQVSTRAGGQQSAVERHQVRPRQADRDRDPHALRAGALDRHGSRHRDRPGGSGAALQTVRARCLGAPLRRAGTRPAHREDDRGGDARNREGRERARDGDRLHRGAPHRRGGLMSPGDRILVVDDDDDIREVMQELLVAEGFQVDVAKDGLDALGKLEVEASPPLILLDMMMPRMDGEAFLQRAAGQARPGECIRRRHFGQRGGP